MLGSLFNKKKRPRGPIMLTLLSAQGVPLLSLPLQDMPIPEDCMVEMSVTYFNDPEPCEIHRGAVRMRAVAEMQQACPLRADVPIGTLSDFLRRCFAVHSPAFVRLDPPEE